jgi:hypothetical protein
VSTGSHEHARVTLLKSGLSGNVISEVTVGLEVTVGPIGPQMCLQGPIELHAHATMTEDKSLRSLELAANIAVGIGVEHYKSLSHRNISYVLTCLKGENLLNDWTVGICLASFMAVGLALKDYNQTVGDMCGWRIADT